MEIMTIVDGSVPSSKTGDFIRDYASLLKGSKPRGFIDSILLKKTGSEQILAIQTKWASMDDLLAMRAEAGKPAAVALFEKYGSTPRVQIFEIAYNPS